MKDVTFTCFLKLEGRYPGCQIGQSPEGESGYEWSVFIGQHLLGRINKKQFSLVTWYKIHVEKPSKQERPRHGTKSSLQV